MRLKDTRDCRISRCPRIGLIGTIITCLLFSAGSAHSRSLDDILAIVYSSNPTLLAERAQLGATDEEVPQALANWRPSVDLTASHGIGSEALSGGTPQQDILFRGQLPTNSIGVNITEPLFRGFRTVAQTREAYHDVDAEMQHLKSVEQVVFLQAITDYVDVAHDEVALNISVANERALSVELGAVTGRQKGGAADRVDVAQAQASFEAAVASRKTAEAQLGASRMNFIRDVGIPADDLQYPADLATSALDEDSAIEAAKQFHPDVMYADYKLRAAREDVSVQKGQALPTLALQGNLALESDASFKGSRTRIADIELKLDWPLYEGGENESKSRQSEQVVIQKANQLVEARQKAEAAAGVAFTKFLADSAGTEALHRAITSNELALEGTKAQQMAGTKTVLDVLNAQYALQKALLQHNDMLHDEVIDKFTLDAAVGELTAVALHLRTPLYNPSLNLHAVENRWFGYGIGAK